MSLRGCENGGATALEMTGFGEEQARLVLPARGIVALERVQSSFFPPIVCHQSLHRLPRCVVPAMLTVSDIFMSDPSCTFLDLEHKRVFSTSVLLVNNSSITMTDSPNKPRRQRAILSCNDCRRRKLKCDRLAPCNRCIKGGMADSCAYGLEAHNSVSEGLDDSSPKKRVKLRHSETQFASESDSDVVGLYSKRRPDTAATEPLEQLERHIAMLPQHVPYRVQESKDQVEFLANSPDLKRVSQSSAVMGMLKGRGYGTHFYGASSAMSVVAHVSTTAMNEPVVTATSDLLSTDKSSSQIFVPL
jgi:hypothetical protein